MRLTIDEIRDALMCCAGLLKQGKPECWNCNKYRFCEEIGLVIWKHNQILKPDKVKQSTLPL